MRMETITKTRPKPVLLKTFVANGEWLGEVWQEGKKENEKFVLSWGFKLAVDHRQTGEKWANIYEKETGENHSGLLGDLQDVFSGKITLDQFYESFF